MSDKAIWPVAFLVSVLLGCITLLLLRGVSTVEILAAFAVVATLASTIAGLFVYNKAVKIEQNTNGNTRELQETQRKMQDEMQAMFKDMLQYVKNSTPIESPVAKDE